MQKTEKELKNIIINYSVIFKKYLMLAILLLLVCYFSIQTDKFLTMYNIKNMLVQSSHAIIAGVGVAFVMISGGLDLSIGYQMSLIGVTSAVLMQRLGMPPVAAIVISLAAGFLLGMFNGLLVVKLKLYPLFITLATAAIFQGISYIISDSDTILGFSKQFTFIGQGYVWEIPFPLIITFFAVLLASVILKSTYFGRYVYGIGENEEAVRVAGVNADRVRVLLYAICGFFVAVASIVLISRSGSASSNMGPGIEFTCLTACILGGISFKGGEGSVWGMVVGTLIITVLGNGMQLAGLGIYPQYIAKGFVFIAAIAFDAYRKNPAFLKARDRKNMAAVVQKR